MQYELTNRYYGIKKIAPSEKAKDHILATSKLDPKDNKPVWVVTKELPDGPNQPQFTKEQLLAMLAEFDEPEAVKPVEAVEEEAVEPVVPPKPKRGRPKKMGDEGASIKG